MVFDVFSVADTVSKADGGTFDGNVTMGGTLAVTGTTALTGNATFSGEFVDSYITFHEKRRHGFSVGYIISDAKHSGYNTGSSVIANKRSYSQIRARLRRLQMDPAGIKQSRNSLLYRNIKEFIKREMRKHLS